MGYPVAAYRNGQRSGGSQNPLSWLNPPRLGFPANDPRGRPGKSPIPKIPPQAQQAARRALAGLGRLSPLARSLDAWDQGWSLYEWVYTPGVPGQPGGYDMSGWELVTDCGVPPSSPPSSAGYSCRLGVPVLNSTLEQRYQQGMSESLGHYYTYFYGNVRPHPNNPVTTSMVDMATTWRTPKLPETVPPPYVEPVPEQAPQWVAPPVIRPNRPPRAQPRVAPETRVAGNTIPGISQEPHGFPATAFQVDARSIQAASPTHRRRPPRRDEKEKKALASNLAAQAIIRTFRGLTEADDLVSAFYDALPKGAKLPYLKGRPINITDKLLALADNWDKVDINQALLNAAKNAIEDKLVGAAEGMNRAIPGRPGGLKLQPLSQPYGQPGASAEGLAAAINQAFSAVGL